MTSKDPERGEDARKDVTAGRDAYVTGRDTNIYKIRNIYRTRHYHSGPKAPGNDGRRSRSRRVIAGSLGLAVIVAAAGTGIYYATLPWPHGGSPPAAGNSPGAPGDGISGNGAADGPWPDFLVPGTVVMCRQGASTDPGTDVTLSAVSVTTGHTVASRTFSLPSWASPGYYCFADDGLASASPARQMFNRSFTSIAVAESLTDGQFATVVNLRDQQAAPVPVPSGFASQPQQEDPQFDPATQEVWYADPENSQIGVFDPGSGRDTVKGHSDAPSVAAGDRSYWPVDGYDWAVSPDGRHIAVADNNVQSAMYLAGAGVAVSDGTGINTAGPGVEVFSGDLDGTTVLPGSGPVDCEAPAAWIDGTHLLCYERDAAGTNIGLVTLAPGGNSVACFQADLLPRTDRTNGSLVLSPDGKSFAFLSLDGTTLTLYRKSLAPGSSPGKITDISTDASPLYFPLLLQWN